MASNIEFVEYVIEQLRGVGGITYKRMFGEYGIYCDGLYYAAICDNCFFVKITEAGKKLMPDYKTGYPYDGAKEMFLIEDLENRELLEELTRITCAELPKPKPKVKKGK